MAKVAASIIGLLPLEEKEAVAASTREEEVEVVDLLLKRM